MANLALGKLPLVDSWTNAQEATNGTITGYTGDRGFAYSHFPSTYTLDLGDTHLVVIIRFLLWDNLGTPGTVRAKRSYKYSLSTSVDLKNWELHYETLDKGSNGWQLFAFKKPISARYVRLHCIHNTANSEFHIIEFEVHDSATIPSIAPAEHRNVQTIVQSPVGLDKIESEVGRQLDNKLQSYTKEMDGVLKKAREDSEAVDRLKKTISEKSEELTSVTRQLNLVGKSLFFEQEAQKNKINARWWFAGICFSFVAFMITICVFVFGQYYHFIDISNAINDPKEKMVGLQGQTFLFESICYLAAKVLFVSLLIYAVVFCVRNHRVQKHNYTINQHKAMSLFSANRFLDNNDLKQETRENILIQATNAIFSHQNSGFADSSSDEKPNIISNIIESGKLG